MRSRVLLAVSFLFAASCQASMVAVADDGKDLQTLARTVDACLQQMGGVDVLINNAGFAYRAEIGAIDVEAMKRVFDTNVFGLVDMTNRVVPMMKAPPPEP